MRRDSQGEVEDEKRKDSGNNPSRRLAPQNLQEDRWVGVQEEDIQHERHGDTQCPPRNGSAKNRGSSDFRRGDDCRSNSEGYRNRVADAYRVEACRERKNVPE